MSLLLRGFMVARMLRAVTDCGAADAVPSDGAVAIEVLAGICGVQPRPLLRILRCLAAQDIFSVGPDGTVGHTGRSRLLRQDAADGLHYAARYWTVPGIWGAWGALDAALAGAVPHEAAWGKPRYAFMREHPEEARLFDALMANFPDRRHAAIAAAYDFSGARLIADIGGGMGATLREILGRHPAPTGVVMDREDVVRAISPDALLDGRIRVQGGSFFEAVPAGADIYLLVCVLQNWTDQDCLRILRTIRASTPPGTRLLIGETVLEPDPTRGRLDDYIMDVQMMAIFGEARIRTRDEFAELLNQSGFALERILPTEAAGSVVESLPR
ncbi:methyltransferase [Dankookia rubra]|uniref:Methyltransferase n=2 Tax=Dankookia rubra TaxID=1442381 RepID=A0A4R5Q5D1_9PROT|nr:methyltransferase [Dankookia rubra]